MKIIQCEQNTPDWLEARMGIPTASEFDAIVTPKWAVRKGQMPESYLARKLAERWLGRPLILFSGGAMEQGKIKEEEAIPYFESRFDCDIDRVGFITNDDGTCGCSPDGMLGQPKGYVDIEAIGIELKCPEAHTHTRYLLDGILPDDYAAQVQGSMYVCGLRRWMFASYCRGFPPLVLTIERDERAMMAFDEAIPELCNKLEESFDRIVAMNGGRQPARVKNPFVNQESV